MPKEEVKKDTKKRKTAVSKTKEATTKKVTKKETEKAKKSVTKKAEKTVKTNAKVSDKAKTTVKAEPKAQKKTPATSSKEKASTRKRTSSKAKLDNEVTAKAMLPEYYDLPYRYNQTIVKILAQTPTILFVYWDISDEDRNSLIQMHGENFFYETRPILVVHNVTKNYSFEIEINDFANSWYIKTQEPNCDYVIELGRRFNRENSEYIYIHSSNDIISPNDHILFEKSDLGNVTFRNVKTNALSSKDFGSLRFIANIDKLYGNIYDIYSRLYNDELLNELKNPSSGEFYLK